MNRELVFERHESMTDYSKLVKSLRCKRDDCEGCDLAFFDKDEGWMCQYAAKDDDAAAAIEELEKEKAIANRKLDSALKKIPKCGKWIRIDKHTIQCPLCHRYLDLRGVNAGRGDANYCPNCGAKMEVQDG